MNEELKKLNNLWCEEQIKVIEGMTQAQIDAVAGPCGAGCCGWTKETLIQFYVHETSKETSPPFLGA